MENILVYLNKNRETIVDYCAALIALFLPISTAIPNLLLIPLAVIVAFTFRSYVVVYSKYILAFLASILFILIVGVLNSSFINDLAIYSRYILIVLVILLFSQVKNKRVLEHFFIVGVLIAVIGSTYAIVNRIIHNPSFLLDTGREVNMLLWVDRPYLGFMLSISVFCCLKIAENNHKRIWYYMLVLLFVGFNIYISARLSIILNIILILIFLYKSTLFSVKVKRVTTFVFFGVFVLAISLSENISSRMHRTDDLKLSWHLIKDYEPRFVIWPCATYIIDNENIMLKGIGSYKTLENKLVNCYGATITNNDDKKKYYLNAKFNAHNQFLDFLLVGGIVPFILLVYTFVSICFSKNSAFELKFILALFLAFFFVENVLHRQLGVYLFSIFFAIYSGVTEKKSFSDL